LQYIVVVEQVGVRSRAELQLTHGLEFLEPIVASCLQWDHSLRPAMAAVRRNFFQRQPSVAAPQFDPSLQLQRHSSAREEPFGEDDRSTERLPGKGQDLQPPALSRGNPKYGKCTVDDCTSYKIKPHFASCWKHLPQYLPNELKVSEALQRAGLLERLWPCDLIATLVHAKAALKLGLLPFAIISFLKVPGSISRFMAKLGSASSLNAEVLLRGLQAAYPSGSIVADVTFVCLFVCSFVCMFSAVASRIKQQALTRNAYSIMP
jgi:hypothetical protein